MVHLSLFLVILLILLPTKLRAAEAVITLASITSGHRVSTIDLVTVSTTLGPVEVQTGPGLLDDWLNQILPLTRPGNRRTTVKYEIQLYEITKPFLWVFKVGDKLLGAWQVEHWAEGLGFTTGWKVYLQEQDTTRIVNSIDEVRRLMINVSGARLMTLPKGVNEYYLKVRAIRETYLLGAGFTTEWYQSETVEIRVVDPPKPDIKISKTPEEVNLNKPVSIEFDAFGLIGNEGEAYLTLAISNGLKYNSSKVVFAGDSQVKIKWYPKGKEIVWKCGDRTKVSSDAMVFVIDPLAGQTTIRVEFQPTDEGLQTINYSLIIDTPAEGCRFVRYPETQMLDEEELKGAQITLNVIREPKPKIRVSANSLQLVSNSLNKIPRKGLTVFNHGDADLRVDIDLAAVGFSIEGNTTRTIAPYSKEVIEFIYNPGRAMESSGFVVITSNDIQNKSLEVQLQGNISSGATDNRAPDLDNLDEQQIPSDLTSIQPIPSESCPRGLLPVSMESYYQVLKFKHLQVQKEQMAPNMYKLDLYRNKRQVLTLWVGKLDEGLCVVEHLSDLLKVPVIRKFLESSTIGYSIPSEILIDFRCFPHVNCDPNKLDVDSPDLNDDGKHELFISDPDGCSPGGNCLFTIYESFDLEYGRIGSFGGYGWSVLDSKSLGYHDIAVMERRAIPNKPTVDWPFFDTILIWDGQRYVVKSQKVESHRYNAGSPDLRSNTKQEANIPVAPHVEERPTFTPYDTPPQEILGTIKIDYPESLKENGIGGITTLWLLISKDGNVRKIQIAKSSGNRLMDQAAVKSLMGAKFKPAIRSGEPVEVWITWPAKFQ